MDIKKILRNKWVCRNIIRSIIFNFRHLPLRQAIKLPIILYKPDIGATTGKFIINGPIRPFMIELGRPIASIFPNTGIYFENRGIIEFNGPCKIGNASALSVGDKGRLCFGSGFVATSALKLACLHSITFGNGVMIGWDCLFSDSDFHRLKFVMGGGNKGYGKIIISDNTWIAMKCVILKNTYIPEGTIISAGSQISGRIESPKLSVIGPNTAIIVKKENVFRDPCDDIISYPNVNN